MELSLRELFHRFLLTISPDERAISTYYTIALFLNNDGEFSEDLTTRKYGHLVDVDVVEAVLRVASPIEIAMVLWSPPGWALPLPTFRKWFEVVISATKDFRALTYAAGAAYDRLRKDPTAVDIPPELIDLLLSSPMPDARCVAAKLVGKFSSNATELVRIVSAMIQSASEPERMTGALILTDAVDSLLEGRKKYENAAAFLELRPALQQLMKAEDSRAVRDNTKNAVRLLSDLKALENAS